MGASIWENEGTPIAASGVMRSQRFVATAAQTEFTLTAFAYSPGTDSLLVFINGVAQSRTVDFVETSASVVTLVTGVEAGDIVLFVGVSVAGVQDGSDPVLRADLAASSGAGLVGITDAGGLYAGATIEAALQEAATFTPAGTGAVATTVQAKLRESVSVFDFMTAAEIANVVSRALTIDVYPKIAAALTAIKAAGKRLYFPPGSYLVSSTVALDDEGLTICGAGAGGNIKTGGSSGVVPTATLTGATQIVASHNAGPVIHISRQGCTVRDMTIARTSAAFAAAYNTTDIGVLVCEADDAGYTPARFARLENLRIINQPSDGVLFASDTVSSSVFRVEVNCVKGNGFFVASGVWRGMTNKGQPGQITFSDCVAAWCGGHSFRVGGGTAEVDGTDIPYRVLNINFESFFCCITPAICVSTFATVSAVISGYNHTWIGCAVDGMSEFPSVAVTHSALGVRGANCVFLNCRLVQCLSPAAICVGPASGGGSFSRGLVFDNIYVVNSAEGAGYFNPVVSTTSGVRGISVSCYQTGTDDIAAIAKLTTRTIGSEWSEDFNHTRISETPTQIASGGTNSGLAQMEVITLADDKAGYFEWDGVTKGILMLSGSASAAQSAVVAFRCGSAQFVSPLGVTANLDVTTGTLAGTTGVDTKLTVSADGASNRVYIENRTGGLAAWGVVFIACNTNSPGNGVVSQFVNLP